MQSGNKKLHDEVVSFMKNILFPTEYFWCMKLGAGQMDTILITSMREV